MRTVLKSTGISLKLDANAEISKEIKNMEIIPVNNIRQVMEILF
jgi:hypothetical protein